MPLADDPGFRTIMQLIEKAEYAEALQHFDALLQQLNPKDRLTALLSKIPVPGCHRRHKAGKWAY